jgi:hypothetical protein
MKAKGVSDEQFHEASAKWLLSASPSDLSKMSEAELAAWQWRQTPGGAAFAMAEREFQKRAQAKELRVGLLGAIGGAIIGALITYLLSQ